jgi:outer membrane protein assembly factor BamD
LPQLNVRASALVLTLAAAAVALSACAGHRRAPPKPDLAYQERPVELLYSTGADKLDHHQWTEAMRYFDEVERQHPYSEWARRSILMTAFAQYEAEKYDDAVATSDRFISLYPGNPSTAYAFYLKAVCYFEEINDIGRDQAATEQALAGLREVIKRYPTSEYAVDAKIKLDLVYDQLAGKEMAVGRYYLRQNNPLAAIGRFKAVIDRYQTTSHTPEALYRLVAAYLQLGLKDEAAHDGAVLGYNFPGDRWYTEAYNLLTSKGLKPIIPPKEKRRTILNQLGHG